MKEVEEVEEVEVEKQEGKYERHARREASLVVRSEE